MDHGKIAIAGDEAIEVEFTVVEGRERKVYVRFVGRRGNEERGEARIVKWWDDPATLERFMLVAVHPADMRH